MHCIVKSVFYYSPNRVKKTKTCTIIFIIRFSSKPNSILICRMIEDFTNSLSSQTETSRPGIVRLSDLSFPDH